MKHGGNRLLKHIVLPDLLPVVAQYMAVADANGDLAGVRDRRIARQIAEEVRT